MTATEIEEKMSIVWKRMKVTQLKVDLTNDDGWFFNFTFTDTDVKLRRSLAQTKLF